MYSPKHTKLLIFGLLTLFLLSACRKTDENADAKFDPEKRFGKEVVGLCGNETTASEINLISSAPRIAIVNGDGSRVSSLHNNLPEERQVAQSGDAELVLCVNPATEETADRVGSCSYVMLGTDGQSTDRDLPIYRHHYDVQLYEPITRSLIASDRLNGDADILLCPLTIGPTANMIWTNSQTPGEVLAWVDQAVALVDHQFGNDLAGLCENVAIPAEPVSATLPSDAQFAVLNLGQTNVLHVWHDAVPDNHRAANSASADYVICVSALGEGEVEIVETCNYTVANVGNLSLEKFRFHTQIAVVDVTTRDVIAGGSIAGPEPQEACGATDRWKSTILSRNPDITQFSWNAESYQLPDVSIFQNWIAQLIEE